MLDLDRRQPWQKALDRVRGINRSFRLDPRIEGVVLALNSRGIHTTQSCEGHLERGFRYPWVRVVEDDCATLEGFLEAFYQRHTVPYDRMMQIEHILTDEYMLRPHGGLLQKSRTPDERAAMLSAYQDEMCSFAEFLKEKFFND